MISEVLNAPMRFEGKRITTDKVLGQNERNEES